MAERKLRLLSTVLSDVGYVRANNQDSGFAGSRIIAMADGMGGHAGGDTASTIAIRTLAHIERSEHRGTVLSMAQTLEKSILAAHDAIVGRAKKEHQLAGMGTTVDTVALTRGWWVLAHIGDSRAYLLRSNQLIRVTKDHSYVQHLVDTGRISEQEARNHPQKNVVVRVLGDFDIDPHPDISIRRAQAGDRWLLCSDGLCGPLEDETIREIMLSTPDREECAQLLVNAALKAGSTDNVTAVVADAQYAPRENWSLLNPNAGLQVPLVAGAAEAGIHSIADVVRRPVATAPKLKSQSSPAEKAALLAQGDAPDYQSASSPAPASSPADEAAAPHADAVASERGDNLAPHEVSDEPVSESQLSDDQILVEPTHSDDAADEQMTDTGEIPIVQKKNGTITADPSDPAVKRAARERKAQEVAQEAAAAKKKQRRIIAWVVAICMVLAVLASGATLLTQWAMSQWYVGMSNGKIAIYQGVPTQVFGLNLNRLEEETDTKVSSLPRDWQTQLSKGVKADNKADAVARALKISQQAKEQEKKKKQEDQEAKNAAKDAAKADSSKDSSDSNSSDSKTSASSANPKDNLESQANTSKNGGAA